MIVSLAHWECVTEVSAGKVNRLGDANTPSGEWHCFMTVKMPEANVDALLIQSAFNQFMRVMTLQIKNNLRIKRLHLHPNMSHKS